MLRTNLSTRPFYNTRAVGAVLGALVLLVVGVSVFNLVQFARLTLSERALGAQAATAEVEADRLRAEAARIRGELDPRELRDVTEAAGEANALIDLRAFSWSELFERLEETLPPEVRVTQFQPRLDDEGRLVVVARVEARRVSDLETFLEALERTGAFRDVLATEEQRTPEGLLSAAIEGLYTGGAGE